MTKKTAIPLLTAITVVIGVGLYLAPTPPAVALTLTWSAPDPTSCYDNADGYIVQRELDGEYAGTDTVFTNSATFVPGPGTHRYRVIGFSIEPDGTLKTGEFMDENCTPDGIPNWSVWSDAVTVSGSVGQVEDVGIEVGVK